MLGPGVQDQIARDEAAYLERRSRERKKRRAIGIVMIVLGLACGGIMILNLATGGEKSVATLAPLGAAFFTLIAGLDRLR